MNRAPQSRKTADGLHVRLINGDTLRFRRFEFGRVLLHRYFIVLYLVLLALLILADPSGQQEPTPLNLRSVIYGIGLFSTVFSLFLIFCGTEALRGGKGRPVVLHGSPVMFLTSVASLVVTQIVSVVLIPAHVIQLKLLIILAVFYYVLTELLTQLAAWLMMDRVLAELRSKPEADVLDPPARGATVSAGGHSFESGAILHLEARGNYVAIHTEDGEAEVPGPFSALLAQMPEGLGLRIHRSHWVARRAVTGHRRSGRDILLDLVKGGQVPVALPRHREVLDWLRRAEGDTAEG